jgi:ABC-type branched-subunit amino acid transport system substrate-binding protein
MKAKTLLTLVVALGFGFFLLVGNSHAEDVYKIGMIGPLSGNLAVYGLNIQKGIDLGVERLNAMGGIKGKKIVMVYEDNVADPATTVSAMKKLVEVDKLPVVIGVVTSTATLAACPIAEESKVVLIAPPSTSPDITTRCGDYTFRVIASDSYQGVVMADVVWDLGYKEAAAMFVNSDYGRGLNDAFMKSFVKKGGKALVSVGFEKEGGDFRTELLKIKASKAKVVMVVGHPAEASIIFKQAQELGIDVQWLASEGIKSEETIKLAGNAANGILVMSPKVDTETSLYKAFRKDFVAKYKEEPPIFSDFAYDALNMVAKAIETGGYTGPGIKDGLNTVGRNYAGVTGDKTFDQYGDVAGTFEVWTIKKEKIIPYKK